jgi:2-amino-4-hydroxy-6-hydroxymethyldihydropteridine diphosphokinase
MADLKMAYIGLGSNLNEPEQQLQRAFEELDGLPSTRLMGRSSLYRNPPMGAAVQPDYINAVARLETGLNPVGLLEALQQIEQAHDRRHDEHWGPRSLDLDLLLYDQEQINSDTLTVPHPGLTDRNFVLYPLAELDANLEIPGAEPLVTLLKSCSAEGLVKLEEGNPSTDVGC